MDMRSREIIFGRIFGKESFKHKKTTRRWFHDTAYCFDYSALSQWYPERDLNPHSANAEGF